MLLRPLAALNWREVTEFAPALLAACVMPLTFSVINGIALGCIAYVGLKLLCGHWREVHWAMLMLAIGFCGKAIWLPGS